MQIQICQSHDLELLKCKSRIIDVQIKETWCANPELLLRESRITKITIYFETIFDIHNSYLKF